MTAMPEASEIAHLDAHINKHLALLELMRFRHFKRYYFGTAYDWERIDSLLRRIARLADQLPGELQAFRAFLSQLI